MIEIAFRRTEWNVVASPTIEGWEQGEVDRGRQDKSADGCRAHVVGWISVLVDFRNKSAGASSTNVNDFKDRSAVSRFDRIGVRL